MNASGSETELGHKKKDQVKTFNSFSFFGYALISYHPIFISTVTDTHTEAYTEAVFIQYVYLFTVIFVLHTFCDKLTDTIHRYHQKTH